MGTVAVENDGIHGFSRLTMFGGSSAGALNGAFERPHKSHRSIMLILKWELKIHQPQFINGGGLWVKCGESSLVKEQKPYE